MSSWILAPISSICNLGEETNYAQGPENDIQNFLLPIKAG